MFFKPFRGVVQTAKEEGFGGEGASIAEAFHALSMGIRPEDVVFDSPCKTKVKRGDSVVETFLPGFGNCGTF